MPKSIGLSAGVALVAVAALATTACKTRSTSNVLDAETGAVGEACTAAVGSDNSSVSYTSLAALLERAKNPACKARFLQLPLVRQTKGFTCGAAATMSILSYFGDFIAETELQRILRSHKDNGTSFSRIIRLFNALNEKTSREQLMEIEGFDTKVDLGELEIVLADPAVLGAIKKKAATDPVYASVAEGIVSLRDDAVDIDAMGHIRTGLGLTDDKAASETVDVGPRSQYSRSRPQEAHGNKYSMKLYFEPRPYAGSGPLPRGCYADSATAPHGDVGQTRPMTMADLTKAIDEGSPVLALTQAWTYNDDKDYDLAAYTKGWNSGHYVVVIGYDEQNVYYMDPYTMGHYAFLPKAEWERRWHDYDGYLAADESTRCPGGTELPNFGLVISRDGGRAHDADQITKMY